MGEHGRLPPSCKRGRKGERAPYPGFPGQELTKRVIGAAALGQPSCGQHRPTEHQGYVKGKIYHFSTWQGCTEGQGCFPIVFLCIGEVLLLDGEEGFPAAAQARGRAEGFRAQLKNRASKRELLENTSKRRAKKAFQKSPLHSRGG